MIKRTLLFLFLFSILVTAQEKFKVDFDYAVFPVNKQYGQVEIYYAFYQNTMKPVVKNKQKYVAGILGVRIQKSENDSLVFQKEYNFNSPFNEKNSKQNLTGLLRFNLNPGKYRCVLVAKDFFNKANTDSANFDFKIRVPSPDRFSLSDIQLASEIKNYDVDPNSYFYKNTLEVVPNPSMVYGVNLPVLYFYNELYNVNVDVKSPTLKVSHYIFDSSNRLRYLKSRYYGRKNNAIVDIGAINIKKFGSGIYTLVVAVSDTVKNLSIKSSKKFYIYNPGVKDTLRPIAEAPDMLATQIAAFSPDEVDEMFAQSSYIATEPEISAWKKLTNVEGKKKFLYRFWKKRDPNPSTPENEAEIEYFKRVKFANASFGNMLQKKGWKTDRGRVYIVYGQPSEIERFPNEKDSKPYEIWHYENIEGGVIFVFADFTGFNDYRLIHSTKRGELSDYNWRSRIMN